MKTIRITDLHEPQQAPALLEMIKQCDGMDIPLDAETFLALAKEQQKEQQDAEIDIDSGLLGRFENAFEEIVGNATTHSAGRYVMQQMAVKGITQTSRMNHILKQYPEAASASINKPLIVAGLPRSGTTHLLQLLVSDPEFLWMKTWETGCPFPSPAMLRGDEPDNREAEGIAELEIANQLTPLSQHLYDVDSQDATEEILTMIHGGHGLVPALMGIAPKWEASYFGTDQTEAFQYLYRQLQALQWVKKSRPDQRWLLKSPAHLGALPSLNKVFPDASLVFTHRDPASVFCSLLTLLGYGSRMYISKTSKEQLIEKTKRLQHGFLKGVVKDAGLFEGRCEHLYFHDLKKDTIGYVEKIYALTGMTYDDKAQARVAEQSKAFSRARRGAKPVYDLEADFGITRDSIREEFSYYLDKFPVEIEVTHK